MNALPITLLFALAIHSLAGPGEERWARSLGRESRIVGVDDLGNAGVIMPVFGGPYAANPRDVFVGKLASDDGRLLWKKSLSVLSSSVAAAVDAGGDVVCGALGGRNTMTARYSGTDGSIVWQRHGIEFASNTSIAFDGQVGFFSIGYDASYYQFLRSFSFADGSVRWQTRIDYGMYDPKVHPVSDALGGAIVTYSVYERGYSEVRLVRVNKAGRVLWRRNFPEGGGELEDRYRSNAGSTVNAAGDIGLAFYYYRSSARHVAFKLSGATGAIRWRGVYKTPGFRNSGSPTCVEINRRGDIFTAGTESNRNPTWRVFTKFASRNGAARALEHVPNVESYSMLICRDEAEDTMVEAEVRHTFAGQQVFLTKYDSAGSVLWNSHAGLAPFYYSAQVVAKAGCQYFGAETYSEQQGLKFSIVKFADGASLKTRSIDRLGSTFAELRGTVNPNDFNAVWFFEIGLDPGLADATATTLVVMPGGSTPSEVNETVLTLQPNTAYYYRVVATANGSTVRGNIRSFRTLP